ncbi:flagellar hook assembly protein FlgD [Ferrimonas marina]|uniref:Basal-body rod modification protein FlgD n=1 Tax=Ferrimonas marina TaxID=299255 RepID=A0A1M5YBK5_9GAMM|nr:flagellar hook assembly protein FlgD [Ferrimonas marina]SHI09218.1 flagellar basal-body rod modification protein FlgD [Ferrimonas marina]
MTTINNGFIDSIKWQEETVQEKDANQALTQEDFFSLLSQQLSMQDPFKPVDNDQMISQMSSFATVDGINTLNDEIKNLNTMMTSNQALEASGLVGQKVLIPSNSGYLADGGEPVTGVVSVPPGSQSVLVRVEDANGQVVATVPVENGGSGNVDFSWNGLDAEGNRLPAGNYSFASSGMVNGQTEELSVYAYAHVSSVTLGGADYETVLNLKGLGGVTMGDVLAVAEG